MSGMGDMGVDEARKKVLAVWPDAYMETSQGWWILWPTAVDEGIGEGVTEDEAWISAASKLPALRPVEEMGVDWESDEAVVRAVWPEATIFPLGNVWSDGNVFTEQPLERIELTARPPEPIVKAWQGARNHPSVREFERKHNPKYAAVSEPAPAPSEPDAAHVHKYEWVDAGPFRDDIGYKVCACGKQEPADAAHIASLSSRAPEPDTARDSTHSGNVSNLSPESNTLAAGQGASGDDRAQMPDVDCTECGARFTDPRDGACSICGTVRSPQPSLPPVEGSDGFEEWWSHNQKDAYYAGASSTEIARSAWNAALSASPKAIPVEGSDGLPPLDGIYWREDARINEMHGGIDKRRLHDANRLRCRERQLRAALACPTVEEVAELEDGMRIRMETITELCDKLDAAEAELATLKARSGGEAVEEQQERLDRIIAWCDAYPEDVFIPVDSRNLANAHLILESHGISLSAIHGQWARHLLSGVRKIADLSTSPQAPSGDADEHEKEMMDLLKDRDQLEVRLDELAEAVGEHFEVPVGEWSSDNDPTEVALEILQGGYKTKYDRASPQAPVQVVPEEVAAAANAFGAGDHGWGEHGEVMASWILSLLQGKEWGK